MKLPGEKFSYAVQKNYNKCVSAMKKAMKNIGDDLGITNQELMKYRQEKQALVQGYMIRDEKSGQFSFDDSRKDEFIKAEERIDKKHSKVSTALKEYEARRTELMSMPVREKITFHTVNEDGMSPMITGEIRNDLAFMISDKPTIDIVSP